MIYRVPTHLVAGIWPSVSGWAAEAMEYHPFMQADDLRELIETEYASLFIAMKGEDIVGFGVLEVVKYPRCRVANVLACGGRRGFLAAAIDELLPVLIDHGKTQGATVVALSGRPGWLRALRHLDGRSQRFITWWADIDEQRRRGLDQANEHARAVETGATVHH